MKQPPIQTISILCFWLKFDKRLKIHDGTKKGRKTLAKTLKMASKGEAPRPSEQELASMYNAFKQDLSAIASKLGELEMEKDEHA